MRTCRTAASFGNESQLWGKPEPRIHLSLPRWSKSSPLFSSSPRSIGLVFEPDRGPRNADRRTASDTRPGLRFDNSWIGPPRPQVHPVREWSSTYLAANHEWRTKRCSHLLHRLLYAQRHLGKRQLLRQRLRSSILRRWQTDVEQQSNHNR